MRVSRDLVGEMGAATLIRGVRPRELRTLSCIGTIVTRPPGFVLMEAGTPGKQAFLILHGRVRCHVGSAEAAALGPGDVVGELAHLDGGVRSATVTTVCTVTLRVLDRRELIDVSPKVAVNLLAVLATRLRRFTGDGPPDTAG